MGTTLFPWLGLLAFVALAQHLAGNEWEKLLWRQQTGEWTRYLKVGFYWGGCGIGFFSLMVILAVDPNLFVWMAATGWLVAYLAVAVASAALVAWCTVEHYDSLLVRICTLLLVSLAVVYCYPILKYFQEGVWLTYPEHSLALALYALSFAAVFRLSVLSLGFRIRPAAMQKRDIRWLLRHPRFVYAWACIALDVLWMLILMDLMRLYPVDFRSIRPGESNIDFALGYTDTADMSAIALYTVVLVLLINVFTRQLSFKVQDVLAWNTSNHVLPMNHSLALENTALVKKALGLANVAVVIWHAPRSSRGIGTDDLRTGTTFISAGPCMMPGLNRLARISICPTSGRPSFIRMTIRVLLMRWEKPCAAKPGISRVKAVSRHWMEAG